MRLALLVAIATLALAGCGDEECKAAQAECGFRVALPLILEDGAYTFTLTADGVTERCTVLWPNTSPGGSSCTTDVGVVRLGDESGNFVLFGDEPKQAAIHVEIEPLTSGPSREVERSFDPSYETTEPWGEDCGKCRRADAFLMI